MEQLKQDLLNCRQKIQQLQIKDFTKQLPITRTSLLKNEVLRLSDYIDKQDYDLEKEREQIFNTIRNIKQEIGIFRKKLKNFDRSSSYLDEIEEISSNIENIQANFKQKMMTLFDQLAEQEAKISDDLENMDSLIESYETQQNITRKPPIIRKNEDYKENKNNIDNDNDNPINELDQVKKKIDRFEERIKLNGGKLCGWDNDEHNEFLRLRTKHHGKIQSQQFLEECESNIPIHSRDQILDHIQKYQKLIDLEETKKDYIQQYKQIKENIQKQELIQAELDEKAKQSTENKQIKTKGQIQKDRESQKEELIKWKMKRVSQKLVSEDTEIEIKKEQERQKQERLQYDQEQKRLMVQSYKEQKQMLQVRQKEAEQFSQMIHRNISSDVKDRIRVREQEMIDKKIQKMETDRLKQLEKQQLEQKKQEIKYVKYAYVEPKLLEITKAAEQHKRNKFNPDIDKTKYADTFGGNLLGAGRRAIPSWRQGS